MHQVNRSGNNRINRSRGRRITALLAAFLVFLQLILPAASFDTFASDDTPAGEAAAASEADTESIPAAEAQGTDLAAEPSGSEETSGAVPVLPGDLGPGAGNAGSGPVSEEGNEGSEDVSPVENADGARAEEPESADGTGKENAYGTGTESADMESTDDPAASEEPEAPEEVLPARTTLRTQFVSESGEARDIRVTYRNTAGIPMEGTALLVSELTEKDREYGDYVSASAEKLGIAEDSIVSSWAFDIKIVDENDHGTVYEPCDTVDVSIRLCGTDLKEYENVDVLHFTEDVPSDPAGVCDMDNTVTGETVRFATDSFSVYMVIGHEEGELVTPRVEFHFISDIGTAEYGGSGDVYYAGAPYEFRNRHNELQTTQILRDGETLEGIADPVNHDGKFFYGWYLVDPRVISGTTDEYGIGTADGRLYYSWPAMPHAIAFGQAASVTENDGTVSWSLGGLSGSGAADEDGCAHVFLAPVFEKYIFVNFMLHPRDAGVSGASNLMTRKLAALGSSPSLDVKVSDVRSVSRDSVHLIFTGWEYDANAGTGGPENWVRLQTVEYSGAEKKDPGRDGVYLTIPTRPDMQDIDLYPIFVEARWVDFVSGVSGSGASFVGSRFLESWGDATPADTPQEHGRNVFTSLDVPTRSGYTFEGWYAFAATDSTTGEITNLTSPQDIQTGYIDVDGATGPHRVTVRTTAVKVADADGSIVPGGVCGITDNGDGTYGISLSGGSTADLFRGDGGTLKFLDELDRLTLYANWTPADSQVTVVYWTENAADDGYSSSAVKTVTTAELSAGLGRSFASGSVVTLEDLQAYQTAAGTDTVSVVSPKMLGEVGAVPADEAKFYDLNGDRSDASKVINGDGSTVFNVYFSRKVFRLVFHIGRDGYVKANGQQKPEFMTQAAYSGWDGNWIQFMFNDAKISSLGYTPGPTAESYRGTFSMTYGGVTYDSNYETNTANVKGDYVPAAGENVYVIEAKYGAYIGDRWPTPSNPAFTFARPQGASKTMYIWAAYYNSLYCRIAQERSTWGGQQGANPDINGVYNYMSAELCSNREGTGIINDAQVHHLVAYFGPASNNDRFKHYHILYEAVDGTYDPETVETVSGNDFAGYALTTWSTDYAHVDAHVIEDRSFYEVFETEVISNVNPAFQMGWEMDGYDYIFSCYNIPHQYENHVYFFYSPKQYPLTFMFENAADRHTDTYYYTQSLAHAKEYEGYEDPVKEGYQFLGWSANESGGENNLFDFESETMPGSGLVLYPVFQKLNYVIRIDPNGAEIDRWHAGSSTAGASTGFRADYKETISAYNFLERRFIPTNEEEIEKIEALATQSGSPFDRDTELFYYMNAQYLGEEHDGNFIPAALRSALYLTAAEIDEYWAYYSSFSEEQFSSRGAVKITDKDEWMDAYFGGHDLGSLPVYRRVRGAEHYSFMGWHEVLPDGSVSSTPFDFNTEITRDVEIRAIWRLDGGYYVQYNPYYLGEEGGTVTEIVGEVSQWTDPADPSMQLYADQSVTHILHAPTNVTPGWIFRGWMVVRANGTKEVTIGGETRTYTNWEPVELDDGGEPVYYQPGDSFTIDAELVTEIPEDGNGSIIHMQACYEHESSSARRPYVTNLILDANDPYGGYVNTSDAGSLPALRYPGATSINTETELFNGRPTQILFGDIQSNIALHLYRYAGTETYHGVQGTNYFSNDDGDLLIGFDENADPESPKTGKAFVPTYAADSVAAVSRNETGKVLYAMWEPMVYVTFVNTTEEPVTVTLTGSGADTVSVVNEIVGGTRRVPSQAEITVPARADGMDGVVKIALPRAAAGTDRITATAVNDHMRKKMTVTGAFQTESPYGTGSENIRYGNDVTYTGKLRKDETGIVVTYTEEPEQQVLYDVNGGEWTETSASYAHLSGDIYALNEEDIGGDGYRPADPVRSSKIFVGWTTNADIASHTDFSMESAATFGDTVITPDAGDTVLDKIRAEHLWDFSQEPPLGETLYAVWSDAVTVTFNMVYSTNVSTNNPKVHIWTGPAVSETDEPYVFYRDSEDPRFVTYTMAKGDRVPMPENPEPHSDREGWAFLRWLRQNSSTDSFRYNTRDANNSTVITYAYDFSQRVTSDLALLTSWTTRKPQYYTFLVENHVTGGDPDEEFEYTIAVSDEKLNKKNSVIEPDRKWGSVTTPLKNGEQYTVLVTVSYIKPSWEGYSVRIDVVDRDGVVVKSAQVLDYDGATYAGFTSEYRYTLTITQEAKDGYETTVETEDVEGSAEGDAADSEERSYTFSSRKGTQSAFTPVTNGYAADEHNTIRVTYTNTGAPIPAPTGMTFRFMPFLLILAAGLILTGIVRSRGKMFH